MALLFTLIYQGDFKCKTYLAKYNHRILDILCASNSTNCKGCHHCS